MNIDLDDLLRRESERVEWKKGVADIDDVVKTAVALANDFANLGDGYIVCGAEEIKDAHGFPSVKRVGLRANHLKEIENHILHDIKSKITPSFHVQTEEKIVDDEHRILIFLVPATGRAHSYRPRGKEAEAYYVRMGRETIEAINGILRELLVKKNEIDPWDREANKYAADNDIDLINLRSILTDAKLWDNHKTLEDYLSDTENITIFLPPLLKRDPLTLVRYPRNFSLLLFCVEPVKYIYGAYTKVSIYPGSNRSEPEAETHTFTGSIVTQARKSLELVSAQAYTIYDKEGQIPNISKYPQRAIQEAVINSIVHRNYEINQPTRITIFADRIEFYSPGALPSAVDKAKFQSGKASPYWRNMTLADIFIKLQLAQAEGQGIPTIIRLMKDNGCPEPVFNVDNESVTCILNAHPRHQEIKKSLEAK